MKHVFIFTPYFVDVMIETYKILNSYYNIDPSLFSY